MKIKVLLVKTGDEFPNGLKAVRNRASEMIDISAFEPGLSDSTMTTCHTYFIKDNKVYKTIRNYFDLDKNERIFLAKLDEEEYNKL